MKRWAHRALVAALLGLWVLPLAPLPIWSVSQRWLYPALLPTEWGGRGWAYLASPGARVGEAFANSLLVALVVTALALLLSLPAGRALGLGRFRGRAVVELLLLLPALAPALVVALGLHITFIRLGLADTRLGVVLAHLAPVLPYTTLTLAGLFARYSTAYEDQARSLGAGPLQVLRHITLPAILPGVMVAALYAFLVSWSQYLLTLLIGGGRVPTLPVLVLAFVGSGDYAVASALSLVFVLPGVLALAATARFLTGRHPALGGFGKV